MFLQEEVTTIQEMNRNGISGQDEQKTETLLVLLAVLLSTFFSLEIMMNEWYLLHIDLQELSLTKQTFISNSTLMHWSQI